MASHLSGWAPNPPLLYHAASTSVNGAVWHNTTTPASGDGANITYNSQSTFVFSLQFDDGTTMYIYMGDRWNFYGPGSVSHSLVHLHGLLEASLQIHYVHTFADSITMTKGHCTPQLGRHSQGGGGGWL